MWQTGSWCSSRVSGLCLLGGRAEFRTLVHQRPPGSTHYQMVKALPQISISKLRPSSTQRPARYSAGHPVPNNYQDRNTTPPISREAAKIIIRSQTPQNIRLDVVLPTRKTGCSLIHQNTGTSPLHEETYTTHWTNLSHWGQTPKTTGATNLQPVKRRPQTQ